MIPARIPDLKLILVLGMKIYKKLNKTQITQYGNNLRMNNMVELKAPKSAVFCTACLTPLVIKTVAAPEITKRIGQMSMRER